MRDKAKSKPNAHAEAVPLKRPWTLKAFSFQHKKRCRVDKQLGISKAKVVELFILCQARHYCACLRLGI
jgi:hypothetical protein